nr:YggS family pyridoxal phosphate-dependent enzyme [uncultured Erwinia sp.]
MKSHPDSPPIPSDTDQTQPRHEMHNRWPQAESVEDFRHNLAAVQARINSACLRAGRDPAEVRLLPVSKTMDEAHIRLAHRAGCTMLGENKVQGAWSKSQAMADLTDLKWSVIGHLQTNKAKRVARFASEFQALDSLHTAQALDRHLQAEGRSLDVFVQVNTSNEQSKYGLSPHDVAAFMQDIQGLDTLRIRGLMTLAEFSSDADRVRACFVRLRTLRDRLGDARELALSMGMSGDFEIAIEEGASVVRVGQAIFGARSLPDDHFWPTEK